MKIIDDVQSIMDRVKSQEVGKCPECRGLGRVPVPEYIKALFGISKWMCMKCHGDGRAS